MTEIIRFQANPRIVWLEYELGKEFFVDCVTHGVTIYDGKRGDKQDVGGATSAIMSHTKGGREPCILQIVGKGSK